MKNGSAQVSPDTAFDIAEGYAIEHPNATIQEAIQDVYQILINQF
jgi:hypothetical protein